MPTRTARAKISTTVAPENYRYLQGRIKAKQSRNLADAVDAAVEHLRRSENRQRLAQATAEYYGSLRGSEQTGERELEQAMTQASQEIDFDREL